VTPPDWLLDLAKIAVGSGFWLFWLGVAFLLIFRKHIAAFIDRTRKLGVGKLAAETEEQKPEQKPLSPVIEPLGQGAVKRADPRTAADELLAQLSMTPFLRWREENFKKALSERGLEPGSPETYRVLTAFVVSIHVTAECEQLYNVIWTTQLQVLHESNTRELTEADIRRFYDLGAAAAPTIYGRYPFTEYLRFLMTQEVLMQPAAGRYAITEKGRTFLQYLVRVGKSMTGRVY
jgi:hypothetical protein